jgi:uncharacterized membrane protein
MSQCPNDAMTPGAASKEGASSGMAHWLWPALVSLGVFGLWGLQSKVVSERISPAMNQILSTPGLLAMALLLWLSREESSQSSTTHRMVGIGNAFLTGVLGAVGNMTFYEALRQGGKAAIVVPLTTLYPMVTLALAALFLREKIKVRQWAGILLALIAILILGQ